MRNLWNQPDWFAAECPECGAVLRLPLVAAGVCWCACGCVFEVGEPEPEIVVVRERDTPEASVRRAKRPDEVVPLTDAERANHRPAAGERVRGGVT